MSNHVVGGQLTQGICSLISRLPGEKEKLFIFPGSLETRLGNFDFLGHSSSPFHSIPFQHLYSPWIIAVLDESYSTVTFAFKYRCYL